MNLSKTLVLVFIEIVGGCRDYEQCYLMCGFLLFETDSKKSLTKMREYQKSLSSRSKKYSLCREGWFKTFRILLSVLTLKRVDFFVFLGPEGHNKAKTFPKYK